MEWNDLCNSPTVIKYTLPSIKQPLDSHPTYYCNHLSDTDWIINCGVLENLLQNIDSDCEHSSFCVITSISHLPLTTGQLCFKSVKGIQNLHTNSRNIYFSISFPPGL